VQVIVINMDKLEDNGVRRILVWSTDREDQLLTLWKTRRCLFDPNVLSTKAERQRALGQVAVELGVAGMD